MPSVTLLTHDTRSSLYNRGEARRPLHDPQPDAGRAAPPGGRLVRAAAFDHRVALTNQQLQKPTNRAPSGLPPGFGARKERKNSKPPPFLSAEVLERHRTQSRVARRVLDQASNNHQIDNVLSRLSSKELNTLAKELNEAGLSQNQLNKLCSSIVSGGASDANLAKLTQAFINNPPKNNNNPLGGPVYSPPPPPNLASTLESSIAKAPVDTRVAYLQALTPGELNAVLTADGGANAAAFVNAAATMGTDPKLQAEVFVAATKALTEMPNWQGLPEGPDPGTGGTKDSAKPLLDALTKLVESNPQGIMAALNHQASQQQGVGGLDPHGQALTNYAEAMFDRGNGAQMTKLFDELGGNDPSYVNNSANNYQNAQSLGYFVGAVQKAIAAKYGGSWQATTLALAVIGGISAIPVAGVFAGPLSYRRARHGHNRKALRNRTHGTRRRITA